MNKSRIASFLAAGAALAVLVSKLIQGMPPSYEELGLAFGLVAAAFGFQRG